MKKSIALAASLLALESACTPAREYRNDKEIIVYDDVAHTREVMRRCVNDVTTEHYVVTAPVFGMPYRGGGLPISVPNAKGELGIMVAQSKGNIAIKEDLKLQDGQTYQVIDQAPDCIQ